MNGVMAARYIRQMDEDCAIIFLSAYDDFNYARNAIKVKALDYLLKPCDLEDLLAVLDMAIQKLEKSSDSQRHFNKKNNNIDYSRIYVLKTAVFLFL